MFRSKRRSKYEVRNLHHCRYYVYNVQGQCKVHGAEYSSETKAKAHAERLNTIYRRKEGISNVFGW